MKTVLCLAALVAVSSTATAQDWKRTGEEAVRTLQEYVRIDTSNPPGDVMKAANFLSAILQENGVSVQRFQSGPGRDIVLARLKGSGKAKPIVLLHHMDVVPTDPSRWQRKPFGGEIAEGAVWGRGAMDMKGPGVVQLFAFLELKRQGVALDRDIVVMAVPDEEVGGELGAAWMRKNHYAEIDPEYIIDEGGVGSRDLYADGKLVFGIAVAEKKIMWLKLRAEGVAGHGSQPHDRNPNDRLVRALARLLSHPVPSPAFEVVETMKARVGTFAANKFTNAMQHSTISLTSLRSGVGEPPKVNVIPSVAEATLDCRILPGTTKDQWLAEIRRLLADPEIAVEVTYESEDPVVTTQDSPLYTALETSVKRHHPEAIITPIIIPFGSDANGYRPLGVKSYGFTPVVVPAAAAMSMHGDAEFMPTDTLGPAIRILFEALKQTAGSGTPGAKGELAQSETTRGEVCGDVRGVFIGPHRCDLSFRVVTDHGQAVAAIVPHTARSNFTAALYDYLLQPVCVTGVLGGTDRAFPFITVARPEQLRFRGTPPAPFAPGVADSCAEAVEMPRLVKEVKPNYTGNAMRELAQGVVILQVIVGVDGSIKASRVMKPLHPELDEQALAAVKQWGFAPGTRDGRPIPVVVYIEMTFTLKDPQ